MGDCCLIEESDWSTRSAIGASEAATAWDDACRLDRAQLLHVDGAFSVRHVRARRMDSGLTAICRH